MREIHVEGKKQLLVGIWEVIQDTKGKCETMDEISMDTWKYTMIEQKEVIRLRRQDYDWRHFS